MSNNVYFAFTSIISLDSILFSLDSILFSLIDEVLF